MMWAVEVALAWETGGKAFSSRVSVLDWEHWRHPRRLGRENPKRVQWVNPM
jgi:hypothetical protein